MADVDDEAPYLAELRRDLRGAEEREAALRDVIQTIARSAFNLDEVFQTVIDRAVHLCHAHHGNIARREGDAYRVAAFTSFTPEYEQLVRERVYRPERGSVIGRTLLERRVVHVEDVVTDPEYALMDLQQAGGYHTVLAARIHGVRRVGRARGGPRRPSRVPHGGGRAGARERGHDRALRGRRTDGVL